MISLTKTLTEERAVALDLGITVHLRPIGLARYSRLNFEAQLKARQALAEAGEMDPDPMSLGQLTSNYLSNEVILGSITGWEGVGDADGNPVPVTPETWALFAELYPGAATMVIAEIRRPGLLAAAEGNGSAPSPGGGPTGAPSTAAAAPSSPATATPGSSAPASAAPGPARNTRTRRSPKTDATSPRP